MHAFAQMRPANREHAFMDNWYLKSSDFFAGMEKVRQAFLAKATRLVFKKNDIIFFEGDNGGACYYIESGVVRIFSITSSGKEPVLFIRKEGEIFGLSEVVNKLPRKANAQVLNQAVLYRLEHAAFVDLLKESPDLAARVISLLGGRIRYLGESLSNAMTCSVMERLAKLLVFIAYDRIHEQALTREPVRLPVQLSQKQLAAMTGSTQPTISELLHELQQEGLIALSGKTIILTDTHELLKKVGMRQG